MLKIAIVGCGKIADDHAAQIRRIGGCEIVGVCDREPLMARQLGDRFAVKQRFGDLGEMLDAIRPDIVHITTPPTSHFEIATRCLQWGSHVYVEKPFTIDEAEAVSLIALAESRGLKLTAGHDDQFRHVARRMRKLVHAGYLGAGPVHMESYYCYELGQSDYAGAILSDKGHWVRKLPGQLLQNVISHGIARIAEFLVSKSPLVIAHGFCSPCLRKMGETDIIDELRVIISEDQQTTAYFSFSSQMRPALHQFRLYGSQNGLVLDQDQETLIKLHGTRRKSYLEKFVTPSVTAAQYLGNVATNLRTFVARDFHMKSGMKYLIEAFYRSIADGTPVPIPYREIILTSKLMDAIFQQLDQQRIGREEALHPCRSVSLT